MQTSGYPENNGYCRFGGRCGRNCSKGADRGADVRAGSWRLAWRLVLGAGADRLRAAGRQVHANANRLGERKHLLSKDITLDTFTKDIFNVIEAEELSNVILVGHSFGGLSISGVADAMPDKIRHLFIWIH